MKHACFDNNFHKCSTCFTTQYWSTFGYHDIGCDHCGDNCISDCDLLQEAEDKDKLCGNLFATVKP